ncbi:unnamed protein product [Symbiodinium sp. CCMP2592]|nr:unnamed protein product [Symbiodinium sp. CCMP2592]
MRAVLFLVLMALAAASERRRRDRGRDFEIKFRTDGITKDQLQGLNFTVVHFKIVPLQDPFHQFQRGQRHSIAGNSGSFRFRMGDIADSSITRYFAGHLPEWKQTLSPWPKKMYFAAIGDLDVQLQLGEKPGSSFRFKDVMFGPYVRDEHPTCIGQKCYAWLFGGSSCRRYLDSYQFFDHQVECKSEKHASGEVASIVVRLEAWEVHFRYISVGKEGCNKTNATPSARSDGAPKGNTTVP